MLFTLGLKIYTRFEENLARAQAVDGIVRVIGWDMMLLIFIISEQIVSLNTHFKFFCAKRSE